MDTNTVMNMIALKRSELENILASGKNLLNKDVLDKSEELDEAIIVYMSGCSGIPAKIGK